MFNFARIAALGLLLSACVETPANPDIKPTIILRGVDSGAQQVVDNYYNVEPDCSSPGYPEIKIIKSPVHGTVSVGNGETYPNFSKDNVRYDCNKRKVESTQLSYQSVAGFRGKDSFTIQIRFATSNLRVMTYNIDVI